MNYKDEIRKPVHGVCLFNQAIRSHLAQGKHVENVLGSVKNGLHYIFSRCKTG
jgi:hypothetical protein